MLLAENEQMLNEYEPIFPFDIFEFFEFWTFISFVDLEGEES